MGEKKEHQVAYGVKLDPTPLSGDIGVRELVDSYLYAYNAARLREACQSSRGGSPSRM
jgi:hypothetical protein